MLAPRVGSRGHVPGRGRSGSWRTAAEYLLAVSLLAYTRHRHHPYRARKDRVRRRRSRTASVRASRRLTGLPRDRCGRVITRCTRELSGTLLHSCLSGHFPGVPCTSALIKPAQPRASPGRPAWCRMAGPRGLIHGLPSTGGLCVSFGEYISTPRDRYM